MISTHVHFFSLKLYPGIGIANLANISIHRIRTNITMIATAQLPLPGIHVPASTMRPQTS